MLLLCIMITTIVYLLRSVHSRFIFQRSIDILYIIKIAKWYISVHGLASAVAGSTEGTVYWFHAFTVALLWHRKLLIKRIFVVPGFSLTECSLNSHMKVPWKNIIDWHCTFPLVKVHLDRPSRVDTDSDPKWISFHFRLNYFNLSRTHPGHISL